MKTMRFARLRSSLVTLAATIFLVAGPVSADSAVVAPNGTLYEVFPARYGDVATIPADSPDADSPVLALRISLAGKPTVVEIVDGTIDSNREGSVSIEFEEATGTLFVAYTKARGLMADMHVAIRRNAVWSGQNILPNQGIYLSINPKVTVTRQQYVDFGPDGLPITKTRSIFSLIWWEESGPSQARYAPIFVEDGELRVDAVTAWNLNELAGVTGFTNPNGLALSSFSYPAVQADPTSNGGVLASYANLVTRRQQVLRITFPDDLVKLSPPGSTSVPEEVWSRAHVPIGRTAGGGRIPTNMDTLSDVEATISQKGHTTFHWVEGSAMRFVRSDDGEEDHARVLALRPDLTAEKAVRLVKALAEKN
jgi:hypothetical protein